MQLTSIVQMRVAYWANHQVVMSIDRQKRNFWVYYYLQLADTLKYISKGIFICIIKVHEDDRKAAKTPWKIQYAK